MYVSDHFMFGFNKNDNALVTTILQIWTKQLVNNNDAMPLCVFMTESYNLLINPFFQNDAMHSTM